MFVHDRYLSHRDLEIIGDASLVQGREFELPWDAVGYELAWCPMLRNIQGVCEVLPRLETDKVGYCE